MKPKFKIGTCVVFKPSMASTYAINPKNNPMMIEKIFKNNIGQKLFSVSFASHDGDEFGLVKKSDTLPV